MKVITVLILFLSLLLVFGVYLFSIERSFSRPNLSAFEAQESAVSFVNAFATSYGIFLSPGEEGVVSVDISPVGEAVVRLDPADARIVSVIEKHALREVRASQVTFIEDEPVLTVHGVRNGRFFGVVPVRVPTDVLVAERSHAFVERSISPWWAWFVSF